MSVSRFDLNHFWGAVFASLLSTVSSSIGRDFLMRRRSFSPVLESCELRLPLDGDTGVDPVDDSPPADCFQADPTDDVVIDLNVSSSSPAVGILPAVSSPPMGGVLDSNPPSTDADAMIAQLDIINGNSQTPPTAIPPYDAFD